jgi:hypothetical protein
MPRSTNRIREMVGIAVGSMGFRREFSARSSLALHVTGYWPRVIDRSAKIAYSGGYRCVGFTSGRLPRFCFLGIGTSLSLKVAYCSLRTVCLPINNGGAEWHHPSAKAAAEKASRPACHLGANPPRRPHEGRSGRAVRGPLRRLVPMGEDRRYAFRRRHAWARLNNCRRQRRKPRLEAHPLRRNHTVASELHRRLPECPVDHIACEGSREREQLDYSAAFVPTSTFIVARTPVLFANAPHHCPEQDPKKGHANRDSRIRCHSDWTRDGLCEPRYRSFEEVR